MSTAAAESVVVASVRRCLTELQSDEPSPFVDYKQTANDLTRFVLADAAEKELTIISTLLFDKSLGLLHFLESKSAQKEYEEAKPVLLDLLEKLIDQQSDLMRPFFEEIKVCSPSLLPTD